MYSFENYGINESFKALGMIQALDMLDASPGWDMKEPTTRDILLQFFNEDELKELRYSEYSWTSKWACAHY